MFDRGSASRYFLHTQCHGCSHHTCQQRILGIIFKVSSAQRISVNVHTRCQPEGDTEQFHLVADHLTKFTNKIQIPGLCQKSSYRNCGTVLIIRSSSFLFWCCEESTLQGRQEISRNDPAILYLIFFFQTQAGRAVSQCNTCHIPWFFCCHQRCLCSRTRYGDTC